MKGRDVKRAVKWGRWGLEHFAYCTTLPRATLEGVSIGGLGKDTVHGTVLLASWSE